LKKGGKKSNLLFFGQGFPNSATRGGERKLQAGNGGDESVGEKPARRALQAYGYSDITASQGGGFINSIRNKEKRRSGRLSCPESAGGFGGWVL